MNLPLVSVIIPTYNYDKYIIEAVNSILEQDYPESKIEIIVADDGSIDNTKEVLSDLINQKIILYLYQPNAGKTSATAKAIKHAKGKYIFNLDADDYFLQNKIINTVKVFESDDSIVHVATPAKQVLPDGSYRIEPIPRGLFNKKLDGKKLLNYLINSNLLYGGGSTYAARASVLKKIEIPDAVDMYTDEFLIYSVLPYGNSFFLDEYLSVWRGHNLNYSGVSKTLSTRIQKEERMINSCSAVLDYLKKNQFDDRLVKLYSLKNLTNKLSHKEVLDQKSVKDIFNYAIKVFFFIRPGWKAMKRYHVVNRLIPTSLFDILKKIVIGNDKKAHFTE